MNEALSALAILCTVLAHIAAACFFLCASWVLYKVSLSKSRVTVWFHTPQAGTETASTTHVEVEAPSTVNATLKANPTSDSAQAVSAISAPAFATVSVPVPEPALAQTAPILGAQKEQKSTKSEQKKELIECGHCHKDILSSPVTTLLVDGRGWMIYVCEHCRTQVKLPVTG